MKTKGFIIVMGIRVGRNFDTYSADLRFISWAEDCYSFVFFSAGKGVKSGQGQFLSNPFQLFTNRLILPQIVFK
jgi:hypothetical protein